MNKKMYYGVKKIEICTKETGFWEKNYINRITSLESGKSSLSELIKKLEELGYAEIEIGCFPACYEMTEFDKVDWYYVIGKKHHE